MASQNSEKKVFLCEADALRSPLLGSLSSGNKGMLSRAASTPEIQLSNDSHNSSTDDKDMTAYKRKYSRPRSVSFHPDIRLYYAATTNDLDEVMMLVESRMADVNATNPAEGATALHGAAYEGNVECIHYLLQNGADVSVCDDDGWTSLHAAVCGRKRKCVELLLTAQCDPFAENNEGMTPFQMAVELEDDKLVKLFVRNFQSLMRDESIQETNV